jgi:hypothetical protein
VVDLSRLDDDGSWRLVGAGAVGVDEIGGLLGGRPG